MQYLKSSLQGLYIFLSIYNIEVYIYIYILRIGYFSFSNRHEKFQTADFQSLNQRRRGQFWGWNVARIYTVSGNAFSHWQKIKQGFKFMKATGHWHTHFFFFCLSAPLPPSPQWFNKLRGLFQHLPKSSSTIFEIVKKKQKKKTYT